MQIVDNFLYFNEYTLRWLDIKNMSNYLYTIEAIKNDSQSTTQQLDTGANNPKAVYSVIEKTQVLYVRSIYPSVSILFSTQKREWILEVVPKAR